jgi:hypothetical protein
MGSHILPKRGFGFFSQAPRGQIPLETRPSVLTSVTFAVGIKETAAWEFVFLVVTD